MLRCRACLTQWSADSTTKLEMRTCFNKGNQMGAPSGASTGSTREVTLDSLTMMTLCRQKTSSITCSLDINPSGVATCAPNSNSNPEDSNAEQLMATKISELLLDNLHPCFCSYLSLSYRRCFQEVSFRTAPTTITLCREPTTTTMNLLLIDSTRFTSYRLPPWGISATILNLKCS